MKNGIVRTGINKENLKKAENMFFSSQKDFLEYFIKDINGTPFGNCYTKECIRKRKEDIHIYNRTVIPKAHKEAMMLIVSQHVKFIEIGKGYFVEKILKSATA